MTAMDHTDLRATFACFPTGVVAVCAQTGEHPVGLSAASFTSVSLTPPLVSVCIAESSSTWPLLRTAPTLGLSVLAADHDAACRQLAGPSAGRFTGLGYQRRHNGAVVLDGSAAWLECTIDEQVEAGDHWLVLLRVLAHGAAAGVPPLVFHASRFRRLAARESG
jgi:flavin reductase (DIM6/NTAB) family NADH-FMN oxidoreductase RutF